MKDILNYIKINENISTSGQPKEDEFIKIAKDNFDVVINLALCSADNALKNEDKIVTELGMKYIHIPVDFKNPKVEDLRFFIKLLSSFDDYKVWVHCAKNYRVTAFMYVYHKYILNTHIDEVDFSMFNEWQPDTIWQNLMKIGPKILD